VTIEGKQWYKAVFPKSQKEWRLKPIKEEKDYAYYDDLVQRTIHTQLNQPSPLPPQPNLPANIAKTPRPPLQELIQQRKTRFGQQ
jgi:hypothetical protein